MKIRHISPEFINALLKDELNFFLDKVTMSNSSYSLEIRDSYINIYYRGGRILKISELKTHEYKFMFYMKYGKRKDGQWCDFMEQHYDEISHLTKDSAIKYFDDFKAMMDVWLNERPRKEREFQHHVSLRQNNDNVLDIEYAIKELNMQLDMIMIDKNGELYIVENKYGNGSVSSRTSKADSKSGIFKHYNDMIQLINEEQYRSNIKESMENILRAKQELGLISDDYHIKYDEDGKLIFHILFVFVDLALSPNSKKMEHEIEDIKKLNLHSINSYQPEYLLVNDGSYHLDLSKARPLFDFMLK